MILRGMQRINMNDTNSFELSRSLDYIAVAVDKSWVSPFQAIFSTLESNKYFINCGF